MADREKVIKELEECLTASCRGFWTCPYSDNAWDAVREALALLREQIDADMLKERLNEICPPAPGATVLMADVFRVINELVQEAEKPKRKPAHVIPWSDLKPGHLYWQETFEDGSMELAEKPTAYDRAFRYWDEWPSKELREATLWDEDEDERRPEAWME